MFYKPYLAQQWIVHEWLFNHRRHLKQSCAYTMTTHHFKVSAANIPYYNQSCFIRHVSNCNAISTQDRNPLLFLCYSCRYDYMFINSMVEYPWGLMQNYSNLCTNPWVFVIHPIFHNPCRNHRKVDTFFSIAEQIMRLHSRAYLGYLI